MAKGYAKAKGRNGPSFVMMRHDIMDSAAWRALSPTARCVWMEIMRRYNGNNNGQMSLSCREAAERCNTSKNTAGKAFKDLQDKGFIKIGEYSDFRMKYKKSTLWIVTHEALPNNRTPTNEWRKWKSDES